MLERARSYFSALLSLDTEVAELMLAALALHHATAILDSSAISVKWIEALTSWFPLASWVILGTFGGSLLGLSALASLAAKSGTLRSDLILRARMAGAALVFVFYGLFGWAEVEAGATWFLVKIYAGLALVAFALYLALYIERHPPEPHDRRSL